MCGLFGFCGDPKIIDKNIARAIQAKVKILGLYNIERGKHSCGLFIDNQIMKGVNEDKLFNDFIQNNHLPDAMQSGVFTVIGHTRMATGGTHSYENAHPFLIDGKFILAHNGVLRNIWTLCNKYGVDHKDIHVDSLGLANIIHKHGFNVLNEYEGFAALLMAKAQEPNSLYIYRGESVRTRGSAAEEERPLYYMQSEEGIYVSSLEKSLLAISDSSTERIKQVEGNIVHKITNGKMTKSKYHVSRDTVNINVNVQTYGGSPAQNYPKQGATSNKANLSMTPTPATTTGATNSSVGQSYSSQDFATSRTSFENSIVPMIWHETIPSRTDRYKGGSGIFYHMGRYWVVSESGEITQAHGSYYINKKGTITEYKGKSSSNQYFFEGILMKNEKNYKECCNDEFLKNDSFNFACIVSKYSDFPVCNTRSDVFSRCKGAGEYVKIRWFHGEGMLKNYGFTPKWSDRNYRIRDGLTQEITVQTRFSGVTSKEETINVESLKAERARYGAENTLMQSIKAPVVQMPPVPIKQSTIPFKDDKKEEFCPDVTNFHRIWENIEQARSTFTLDEIIAISYYVCDVMMYEMEVTPQTIFDSIVDTQLNMFLSMCIENNKSIVDMWDEANYEDIHHYLLLAKENPDGIYKQDESPNDSCEVCQVVPKTPEDTAKQFIDTLKIKQEASSVPPINLNNVNQIFPDEDKKEMIDIAVEREMAAVPLEEDVEETEEVYVEGIEMKEQKEYAFTDTIDCLVTARDCAVDLTSMENDDFAQAVAFELYRAIDPLLYKLQGLCDEYNEQKLGQYIAKQIKSKVGI